VQDATCRRCGKPVSQRPCPHCGGTIMDFARAPPVQQVKVHDFVQRTQEGTRSKKNYHAIFAFIAVLTFETFVILSNNTSQFLIIHWFLSFTVFFAGSFAMIRMEDYFRTTTRRMFHPPEERQNRNRFRRRCDECKFVVQDETSCPKCGGNIGSVMVNNETVGVPESSAAVKSRFFTKTDFLSFGVFLILIGIQWYIAFNFGGMINLSVGAIMGLIVFIPSYYMFFRRHFVDTETLVLKKEL